MVGVCFLASLWMSLVFVKSKSRARHHNKNKNLRRCFIGA
jgi:hypothetical protein